VPKNSEIFAAEKQVSFCRKNTRSHYLYMQLRLWISARISLVINDVAARCNQARAGYGSRPGVPILIRQTFQYCNSAFYTFVSIPSSFSAFTHIHAAYVLSCAHL